MQYAIVVHKDVDSDYGVTVPDLPGCFSAGSTLDETAHNVKEAIECHLEGMLADGDTIPHPKGIEAHRENPDYADGVWIVVDIDLAKLAGKVRRINVSIPERLLEKIDAAARRARESRSGFLTRAALEYVERHLE